MAALERAIDAVGAVRAGYRGRLALPPQGTNRKRYGEGNPIQDRPQAAKIGLLEQIDAYARAKDPRVRQVSASLGGSWQRVLILRADGSRAPTSGLWSGSTSRSWSATASAWNPAVSAPAAGSATTSC